MSRRAALYQVSIHPKGKSDEPRSFGDIDGSGTSAVASLTEILGAFSEASRDGLRLVRSLQAEADGDELFAIVQYGQKGIAADIVSPGGDVRLRQSPADEQLVRFGCLFRLPAGATAGSLAVELDDGRGIKGLVQQALARAFRSRFAGLVLAIEPAADPDELRAAVRAGRVDRLQLGRSAPPGAQTLPDAGKWLAPGTGGRVRVEIAGASPAARLRGELLVRHLDGDAGAFAEIARFAGIHFDTVRVGVQLSDSSRRTFDLAKLESGRAPARELAGIELDADGRPTDASLRAALRSLLSAPGKS
jgi:hypothetical protein